MGFFARLRNGIRRLVLRAAARGAAAVRRGITQWRAPVQPIEVQWYLSDIPRLMRELDTGLLRSASMLAEAFKIDGRTQGLLTTRAHGLFSLPSGCTSGPEKKHTPLAKWFDKDFSRAFPRDERVAFVLDRITIGIALAEITETPDGKLQVVRLPPEHLIITPGTSEVRYLGELVEPGNGRWILWRSTVIAPWRNGIWAALARAFIAKDHAYFLRESYSNTLANPARVAEAPPGSSNEDFEKWFEEVGGWGPNTVLATRDGYTVKIVESNGQGYQVFRATMQDCNEDATFAIAGQTVTAEGTTGFANGEIFSKIRSDLIDGDGAGFCEVVNDQFVPWWQQAEALTREEIRESLCYHIDTEDPQRKAARIKLLKEGAEAAVSLRNAGYKTEVIEGELGLQLADVKQASGASFFGYELDAGICTLDEARASKGLPPMSDGSGNQLLRYLPQAADTPAPETAKPRLIEGERSSHAAD